MGQMVNRRAKGLVALSTLADNGLQTIDGVYGTSLAQQAYLFQYDFSGTLMNIDDAEFTAGDGVSLILHRANATAAELDTILTGLRIDPEDHGEYETRQALYEIAKWTSFRRVDTTGSGGVDKIDIDFDLHFQPKSKGGIPHFEGAGWQLSFMNRTGGPLTTGAIIIPHRLYERFAYGGF